MSGLTLGIGRSFRRSSTGGGGSPSNTGVPASIAISPSTFSLPTIGSTQQFTAVASDINSVVMTGVTFEWYSTDTRYVTVDTDSGLATRIALGGAAHIYARYELLPAWVQRATVGAADFAVGSTGVFASGGTIVDGSVTGGAFPNGQKVVQLDFDRLDTEGEAFQDDSFFGASDGHTPFVPREWYNVDRNRNLETARDSILIGVDEEMLMEWTFAVDSDTVYVDTRGSIVTKWNYPRTGDGEYTPNVPHAFSGIWGQDSGAVGIFTQYDKGVGGIDAKWPKVGSYSPPLVTPTKFTQLHRFDSDWGQGNGRSQLLINDVSQIYSRTIRYSDPASEYTTPGDIMARVYTILSAGDQVSATCPYHRRVWIASLTISTRRYR